MSAAAFNVRWDRLEAAKELLGIAQPIDVELVDGNDEYAWIWLDAEMQRGGRLHIYLNRHLHPEFASMCLWHELAHARQVAVDWGGDQVGMMEDYAAAVRALGMVTDGRGFVLAGAGLALRQLCLLPWEAEAMLLSWERRMTTLTKRGRGPHTYGPQGAWWHFRELHIDLHEIMEIGNQYRTGVRE